MRAHAKTINFAEPYGCSPEDIRLLHLRVALFLYLMALDLLEES